MKSKFGALFEKIKGNVQRTDTLFFAAVYRPRAFTDPVFPVLAKTERSTSNGRRLWGENAIKAAFEKNKPKVKPDNDRAVSR